LIYRLLAFCNESQEEIHLCLFLLLQQGGQKAKSRPWCTNAHSLLGGAVVYSGPMGHFVQKFAKAATENRAAFFYAPRWHSLRTTRI